MKVTVDLTMAEQVYVFLESGKHSSKEQCMQLMDSLEELDSFQKMIKFYDGMFTQKQYTEIFYLALNDLPFESEDSLLEQLYGNLKRLQNIELIHKKLTLIKGYNFDTIKEKLEDALPCEMDLEVHISFVFDGINGGSILGKKDMLLNVMFWPSEVSNLYLIEGILLHEYHHIGIKNLLSKGSYLKNNPLSDGETAQYLLATVMSEGAATHLFNDGHDLYTLVCESHGQEYAATYQESMQCRSSHISEVIKEFESDIMGLLSSEVMPSEKNDLIEKYCFNHAGKEPRDKALGCHMCQVIQAEFGKRHLVSCFDNPFKFIKSYSEATQPNDELKFSSQLVGAYKVLFN